MRIMQEEIMGKIITDYSNGLSSEKMSKIYGDGLSPYIIRENLRRYGLVRDMKFSSQELQNIKNDFLNGMKLSAISSKYHRPEGTIRKKLQVMSVYSTRVQKEYTSEEIQIIKQYYPNGEIDKILELLPHRTKQSIVCKASKLRLHVVNFRTSEDEVVKTLKKHNLTLLDSFSSVKTKHKLCDNDGYLYYSILSDILYQNSLPMKFSIFNPHTIDNIKTYIDINKINVKLLSDEYRGNTHKMIWKCVCRNEFECSWNDFSQGKHTCNLCADRYSKDKYSYSVDKIKEIIEKQNYTMEEETFTRLTNGFVANTQEGYKVIMNRDSVFKRKQPEVFHVSNPYTVENIHIYLNYNNINTSLLSSCYKNNTDDLIWKCECGNKFTRNWKNFFNGSVKCEICSTKGNGENRRIKLDKIIQTIEKNGYILVDDILNKAITKDKFKVIDSDGYMYSAVWSNIKNEKQLEKFYPTNPYTVYNINNFLKINRNWEFTCISNNYESNTSALYFVHNKCGHVFKATLIEMQGKIMPNGKEKYYKQCPKCNTSKTESVHASVLKQVFMHEYKNTICEDRTCINPKTNYPLPTDIVNHERKIAVEIQSSYHDSKVDIDLFKKNFWISNGYDFYSPDIRDYSILEMIQIFFPKISKIPTYIDYNFSDCIDFVLVQKLLNDGYSIKDISSLLNIKSGTINGLIHSKKIHLPDGYKEKFFNIRPIVRLSKEGKFISRFNSIADADRKGFKLGTVRRVLRHLQTYSYGSYWVYENDYENGCYTVPSVSHDKFMESVSKFDMDDNYICSYESIYDAENDSASNKSEILRVASGIRKSSRNEKWEFIKVA